MYSGKISARIASNGYLIPEMRVNLFITYMTKR